MPQNGESTPFSVMAEVSEVPPMADCAQLAPGVARRGIRRPQKKPIVVGSIGPADCRLESKRIARTASQRWRRRPNGEEERCFVNKRASLSVFENT